MFLNIDEIPVHCTFWNIGKIRFTLLNIYRYAQISQTLFITLPPSFSHLIIYHRVQVEIRHYNIGILTLTRLTLQLYLHIPDGVPNTYTLLIQHQLQCSSSK